MSRKKCRTQKVIEETVISCGNNITDYNFKFNIKLNREQKKAKNVIFNNVITFLNGKAGSGKTLLAVYAALDMLQKSEVDEIVIVRAMVGTEKTGFLPGSIDQKMAPWIEPVYDNMYSVLDKSTINQLVQKDIIKVLPLAFARGHTFVKTCVIVDESQNMTSKQLEMILTRLGIDSTIIVCGDLDQIDLKQRESSSLYFFDKLIMENVAHVTLLQNHRHPIVMTLLENINKMRDK